MSGLEIVGVVLGSLPLIISALEHYSDGVSTIKSMQKYESVFEYLHVGFVTNLTIYRNSLEELLSPLALSDVQLYQLLEETNEGAWNDPDLIANLRDRLGSSYLPFKSSVKQLHKKVNLFAHKLQLGDNFKPSWVSDNGQVSVRERDVFFKNPLNRIRGGLNSEKHKQLLSSLQEDIDRIASLNSKAIALEPLRLNRKRISNAAYWARWQRYAEQLYKSLDSRWSSKCACQCAHEANLRLSLPKAEANRATTFNLLLSFDTDLAASKIPWDWRAVEIESSGDVHCPKPQNIQTPPTIVIHATSDIQSWTHCLRAAPQILDLCEALKSDPQTTCCIGILDDADIKHHIHSVILPRKLQKRITLQDVLDNQAGTGFQIKEKCSLALTLANAVLQLHDTPWLSEVWNTSDISILNNGWNPSLGEQPYVSTKFSPANGNNAAPLRGNKLRMIKNATIFALGVALLEISHGRRLSAFETPDDLDDQGKRTLWTDYLIADRLVEDIHRRELPNFANAARRCVHCNFEGTVYSLNNDDFRERFYQGVILPLQRDYDYATGAEV